MTTRRRPVLRLPAWAPLAGWPVLVLVALSGASVGGAVAVVCVLASVLTGVVAVYAASGEPDRHPET